MFGALTALALLGAAPAAAEPVRLVFVTSVLDEVERSTLAEAVDRFSARQDDIEVELVPYQWQGYGIHDAYTRFLALEDPQVDVYLLDVPWVPEFAWTGWLLPLDDRVQPATLQAFTDVAREGGRFADQQWGLPLTLKGNALYYRADLLEAAGLAPPRTLEELRRAAEVLRGTVEVPIALHGAYVYNDVLPMWWASGGGFTRDGAPALDDPTNVAVVEELTRWLDEGLVPQATWSGAWADDYHGPEDAFQRGDAAFLISWSTLYWRLSEDPAFPGRVGVVPVPGLTDRGGSSNLGSWYLAISRYSQHPDAAVAFLEHMASPEMQRLFLELQGEVPSRTDLLDDWALSADNPQLAAFRDILPRGGSRPRVPNEREVSGALEQALQRALRGEADAASALARAQEEVLATWVDPRPLERAPTMILDAASDAPRQAWLPLVLSLIASALLVVATIGVTRSARLTTLRAKLMLFAGTAVLQITLLQAGLALSMVLREQLRELDQQRTFYRSQLIDHAETIGRNLSLAASVISDLDDDGTAARQLLMTSHFSADLLSLELVDAHGQVTATSVGTLFATEPAANTTGLGPEAGRSLRLREVQRDGEQPYIEVLAPIYAKGVYAGALRIGVSESRYRTHLLQTEARHVATVQRFVAGSILVTAALLALAILVIVLLSRQLTAPIVELTEHAARIRRGNLDVPVVARTSDEVGQLARTMAEMVQGLRDRDVIKDAFGRYLSPGLAQRFLDDPNALELGGQLQVVTILMSDLRGFTTLSEQLGPQRTVEVLNRYLGAMTEVILAHDGTINEFLGDAILVLFGAPFPADDDAERAVRCAVRMQQAMTAFNASSRALGLPELEMGIGVCTGEVVAGNIGSQQRVKFGVVGDPINRAARIEGLTVGSQVLLAQSTRDAVGPLCDVVGPMEVHVKGKAEPLHVFEVRGLADDPDGGVPMPAETGWAALELSIVAHAVHGKRVDPEGLPAQTRRANARRFELTTERPLEPFANLKLRWTWPDGRPSDDAYAKVVRVVGVQAVVELTSMSEGDRATLRQLTSA